MHQTETSDHFEAMNVELRKNGRSMLEKVEEESFFYPTLEFMKMKYICMKVKII